MLRGTWALLVRSVYSQATAPRRSAAADALVPGLP